MSKDEEKRYIGVPAATRHMARVEPPRAAQAKVPCAREGASALTPPRPRAAVVVERGPCVHGARSGKSVHPQAEPSAAAAVSVHQAESKAEGVGAPGQAKEARAETSTPPLNHSLILTRSLATRSFLPHSPPPPSARSLGGTWRVPPWGVRHWRAACFWSVAAPCSPACVRVHLCASPACVRVRA